MADAYDESMFRPQRVALVAAAAVTGAPVELLRRGDNLVYRAGDFVIRVASPGVDAARQVAIADMLLDEGIPVPRSAGPARIIDGLPVTVWHRVLHHPAEAPDYGEVGKTINRLHRLPIDFFDAVAELPWCGDPAWLDVSTNLGILEQRGLLDAKGIAALRAVCGRLADWPKHARDDGPLVVCHGDLIPQNIVVGPNGPVLLDWDYLCIGPRAWDHAALLTWADRWGGDPNLYPAFVAGYGTDLSDSPVAAELAVLRLLAPTINKIRDGEHDERSAREGEIRLRYWLDDPDPPHWTVQ